MDDERNACGAAARQANHWLTKRDAGLMTAQDEATLLDWMEANPAHPEAWARAQTIFTAIAAIPAGSTIPSPVQRPRTLRRWFVRRPHRSAWVGAVVAASVAALVVVGTDLPMHLRADAIAATGESRRVILADGSIVLLDSGAAIAFDYGVERRVMLLRGQAAFTVAADRTHPFVVEARGGTTTALGTRFIVNRIEEATRVTVTEHSVRVVRGPAARTLAEGASAFYGAHGVSAPAAVNTAEIDAWTRGRVRFVDRPLREVVAELGRYHPGYIGMVGGRLGDLPVNGVFSTRDPVGALDTIQRSLGLTSYRIADRIIVLSN